MQTFYNLFTTFNDTPDENFENCDEPTISFDGAYDKNMLIETNSQEYEGYLDILTPDTSCSHSEFEISELQEESRNRAKLIPTSKSIKPVFKKFEIIKN